MFCQNSAQHMAYNIWQFVPCDISKLTLDQTMRNNNLAVHLCKAVKYIGIHDTTTTDGWLYLYILYLSISEIYLFIFIFESIYAIIIQTRHTFMQ